LLIGDMPAGQRIGPLEGEADPLPAAVTAKWGPFGRRRRCWGNSGRATPSLRHPSSGAFSSWLSRDSHLDCRAATAPAAGNTPPAGSLGL